MLLTRHRFALLALVAVAIVWPTVVGCSGTGTSVIQPAEANITDEPYETPASPRRSFDYYRDALKQLPLRLSPRSQDFSDQAALGERDSEGRVPFMVGLYYTYRGDRRDVYALFSNNHLFAVTADEMRLLWTVDLGARPLHHTTGGEMPFAVSDQHLNVMFKGPKLSRYLRAPQPNGIQLMKRGFLTQLSPSSPLAANDRGVYFGVSNSMRVERYSQRYELPDWYWPENPGAEMTFMRPVADNSRVYLYNRDGHMYCLLSESGEQAWKWPVDAQVRLEAPFTVKSDLIFVGTWGGRLVMMDKSSEVLDTFYPGEPIVSQPFVSDDHVFFQTPTHLMCVKVHRQPLDDGTSWFRFTSLDELEAGSVQKNEPDWKIPLLRPERMRGLPRAVLADDARLNLQVLLKGERWVYLLQTEGDQKVLYRVAAGDGEFEVDPASGSTDPRGFDVSDFEFIVGTDDEARDVIYFGTAEGFIFAMTE
jgi:hypothetical protein